MWNIPNEMVWYFANCQIGNPGKSSVFSFFTFKFSLPTLPTAMRIERQSHEEQADSQITNDVQVHMWCTEHIKRGDLAGEVNFEFDVLDLFLCFKMMPHLSKLIKTFIFYNWKWIENSYCFLDYMLNVFIYKKAHSHRVPLSDVLHHI